MDRRDQAEFLSGGSPVGDTGGRHKATEGSLGVARHAPAAEGWGCDVIHPQPAVAYGGNLVMDAMELPVTGHGTAGASS